MKKFKMFFPVVVGLVCIADIDAQDWPQYLGPERNSTSDQKNILRTWPEKGTEVVWSVNVGIGYGGPVVKDGLVYLLDRDDQVGDNLRCLRLSDGKELWNFEYDAPGSFRYSGSRSVPTLDGDHIYSCGPFGHLYCIDIHTQRPIWQKNIWTDFGGDEIPSWAITQNPLVYGELLILASQAPQAGVVAYEKYSGAIKWTTPSLGRAGYVSPSIVKVKGKEHVVMISASERRRGEPGRGGKVIGIDPLTGKILWEYTNWQCRTPIPSPFDAGDGKVLILGGYRAGAAMIQIEEQTNGSYQVSELFKNSDFGAHTQPPILHNGYFYVQFSTNDRRDGLVCMSIDGQIMWKTKRDPSFDKGSMILADGLILATNGNKTLYLIEPDPTGFKPLASADLLYAPPNPDGQPARVSIQNWAPIALADGKLLIRDQSRLMCVKVVE